MSEVPMVPLLIYAESACPKQLWGLGCIPECSHLDCSVNLDVYIMALDFAAVVIFTHATKIWRMSWGTWSFAFWNVQGQGKLQVSSCFSLLTFMSLLAVHIIMSIGCLEAKNLTLASMKQTFSSGKYFLKNNFGVFSKLIHSIHYCCNSLFIIFSRG